MPVIEFPKQKLEQRVISEDEMKAVAMMFWQANILARRTLAGWSLRKKKPTEEELFNLTQILHGAETIAEGIVSSPSSDGIKAIQWMKIIVEEIERLNPADVS